MNSLSLDSHLLIFYRLYNTSEKYFSFIIMLHIKHFVYSYLYSLVDFSDKHKVHLMSSIISFQIYISWIACWQNQRKLHCWSHDIEATLTQSRFTNVQHYSTAETNTASCSQKRKLKSEQQMEINYRQNIQQSIWKENDLQENKSRYKEGQ